ncbi:hypothetical protein [Neolewinella persica]|uniref:hypothetical protein n=1 Tax=Neolewinella persica TaxID=70998 RepID=UPI0003697035|nr:hypothetical protein [Neolewinella persica]
MQHDIAYGFPISNCEKKTEFYSDTHFIIYDCEEWEVQIDYGYGVYSSSTPYSGEEYIKSGQWKINAIPKLKINNGEKVDIEAIMDSMSVVSIGDDLHVNFSYFDSNYSHAITVPEEVAKFSKMNSLDDGEVTIQLYGNAKMNEFQYFMIDNSNKNSNFPKSLSIHVKTERTMTTSEVSALFENISFPPNE